MKALVGAFNQKKALVGAFSVIVKTDCETDGALHSTSSEQGGGRGEVSGHCIPQIIVTFVSSPRVQVSNNKFF